VAVAGPASNTDTTGVFVGSAVVAGTFRVVLVGPEESDGVVPVGFTLGASPASTRSTVGATVDCTVFGAGVSIECELTIVTLDTVVIRATGVPRIVAVGVAVTNDVFP